MPRYELTGSGISDGQNESELLDCAKLSGAKNPRLAYHYGWRNQPKTIRFSASDWQVADDVADRIRTRIYPENARGALCPMIRAYPVNKEVRP